MPLEIWFRAFLFTILRSDRHPTCLFLTTSPNVGVGLSGIGQFGVPSRLRVTAALVASAAQND
ncbi:MAG: hypothetical protein ACI87E_002609, partial [Mariniblastus sp.]